MNSKEWRPPDWDSIKHIVCDCNFEPTCDFCSYGEKVENIASAMLKALIKWLFEPCTEHPDVHGHTSALDNYCQKQRRFCLQCMEQLKGE